MVEKYGADVNQMKTILYYTILSVLEISTL